MLFFGFAGVLPANAGASGTVKVDGEEVGGPGNAPHEACGLQVSFYGFPVGAHDVVVTWTSKDTGTPAIVTTPPSGASTTYHITSTGGAIDGSLPFALHTAGLSYNAGAGGYHVELDVSVDGVGKSKTIWVGACATDAALSKSASPATVGVGGTVTYTLTVTNNGPLNAVGFQVTDPLPPGFTLTSVNASSLLWDCVGSGVDCTYRPSSPPITAGNSVSFTVTGTANGSTLGTMTNTANLDPVDSNTANNSASASVTVTQVTDTAATPTRTQSECVNGAASIPSYTIVATPGIEYKVGATVVSGTVDATAGSTVVVTATATTPGHVASPSSFSLVFDPAPTDCTITAATPQTTQSACSAGVASTPTYTIVATPGVEYRVGGTPVVGGPHDATAGSTVVVTTHATAAGHVVNPASFSLVFDPAPDCTNPSATISKSNNANNDEAFSTAEEATTEGQQVRFKLHVTNTSTYAINVGQNITDKVWLGPDEPVSGGSQTYECESAITNLAPGASADCYFNAASYAGGDAQVKSDRATLTLTKYVPPSFETLRRFRAAAVAAPFTATSNVSTVTTRFPRALAVAPTVIPSQCVSGSATLPSFTVPVTPGVVYSPAVGGTGAPGTTTKVTATAAAGFVLSNPADSPFTVVFGLLANCAGPPPVIITPTPPPPPAPDENLGLSKTGPGTAKPGDELVYAIDVKNVKGTPATAFTVTDVLPDGLSYSNAEGTGFACANAAQVITCVYSASLAVGQSATITVRALLDSSYTGKTVANTAVVDPGRADTDAADNTATATTDITAVPVPVTGGGGGAAEEPAASPEPQPAAGGGGGALPFTGMDSGQILKLGVTLLLAGFVAALVARRRRTQAE
jgi:uncharacterized repeat protein (TIGR01451 family)